MLRFALLTACFLAPSLLIGQEGYYRQPALTPGGIVFVSEGDLWVVPRIGGKATRLTTHPGRETSPRISSDGKTLAFVANYEGSAEVYTMNLSGGPVTRRTWGAGRGVVVCGFSPKNDFTSDQVVYASTRRSALPTYQLFSVDLETGKTRILPFSQAWQAAWGDKGIVFTRLRHTQHTKRYVGGTAEQLWHYDYLSKSEAKPLTSDYDGTSHHPMVVGERIYFVSDRDETQNIWSMNWKGKDLKQHTHHVGWDVMEAQARNGSIVYRVGADIWMLDASTGESTKIPIQLQGDFDQLRERWVEDPKSKISSVHLKPNGKGVVITARGQVFTATAEEYDKRVVTVSANKSVRFRGARQDAKTKRILALGNSDGENEIWSLSPMGIPDDKKITDSKGIQKTSLLPSPDGIWMAWTDRGNHLWARNLKTKTVHLVDSKHGALRGLTWTPDSRWLAYVRNSEAGLGVLALHDLATKRTNILSSARFSSFSPAFTPDGKWLYFLSDRHFSSKVGSPWGSFQPEPFFQNTVGLYAIALAPNLNFEFGSTVPKPKKPKAKKEDKKDPSETESKKKERPIDFPRNHFGLYRIPLPAGRYGNLRTGKDLLFFTQRSTDKRSDLMALTIQRKYEKPKTIVEGIRSYELSADMKKMLIVKEKSMAIVPAKGSAKVSKKDMEKGAIKLAGWKLRVAPKEDWKQIFDDAWRMHRDWFYDPGMHGVDWVAMGKKYRALVPRIGAREELNDLLGQLIGELSALHSRASGGEHRSGVEDISNATLGARISVDPKNHAWRIDHIYGGDPERPDRASPLARPDLRINNGTFIVAIDDKRCEKSLPIEAHLLEKSGQQVRLTLAQSSDLKKTRDVLVRAIGLGRDRDLRYDEWEWTRSSRVAKGSAGKIGYVHLRAMGSRDIAAWVREYASQYRKQGLIIDVRGNNGGNIDSWILDRLSRKQWMYWQDRNGQPDWNMQRSFRGYMVVLCDGDTASDGEAFAEGFKRLELGKVIGTRTWGGEIWLSRSNRLVDRGVASAGEFGVYSAAGEWLIEGHGVEPDIEIDNLPVETFNGRDRQLSTAISHLNHLIDTAPRPVPQPPEFPNKSSQDNRLKK